MGTSCFETVIYIPMRSLRVETMWPNNLAFPKWHMMLLNESYINEFFPGDCLWVINRLIQTSNFALMLAH